MFLPETHLITREGGRFTDTNLFNKFQYFLSEGKKYFLLPAVIWYTIKYMHVDDRPPRPYEHLVLIKLSVNNINQHK